MNSLKARLPRVEAWLADVRPDVLCIQETKMAQDAFPTDLFSDLGYESVHHGEGRWNGVAILSQIGLDDPIAGFAAANGSASIEPDVDARLVSATCGGVRIHSVYVPNGREVDHDHFHYKLSWLARLRSHLEATADPLNPVIVAGDWNIAPTSDDVWDTAAFEGATHVTDRERAALSNIIDWGLVDTFRENHPGPGLYSYYDYQAGRFHKREGIRIDFVLSTESLAQRCVLDVVDRNGRKGTKPSDHCPVISIYRDPAR